MDRDSRNGVYLTVPGKMCTWLLPGPDQNPSLIQFLSEVYGPWLACMPPVSPTNAMAPEETAAEISRMKPQDFAASVLREGVPALDRPVVAWPDWAGLKIRRPIDSDHEDIIPVKLTDWMAAPTGDLPEDAYFMLQAGDIVELPVLKDHPPGPWPGLDAAVVRLFQKALQTKVTLVEESGRFREVTATWLPPRWVDTPAGLLPVPDGIASGGRVRFVRAWSLVESAAPAMAVSTIERDGKTYNVINDARGFFLRPGDILNLGRKPEPPRAIGLPVPGSLVPSNPARRPVATPVVPSRPLPPNQRPVTLPQN